LTLDQSESADSRTNLRERKKSATRRALEEAALDLFKKKGFARTSVDEIAAAADVSRSTFFRYYGSKEAVFFDDTDTQGERFLDRLVRRPGTEGPLAAFREALIEVSAMAEEEDGTRDRAILRRELMLTDPTLNGRRAEEFEKWTAKIAHAFAQRAGRSDADAEDRVAAAICMAATEEIGEEWRRLVDTVGAATAIQTGFERVRRLIADV